MESPSSRGLARRCFLRSLGAFAAFAIFPALGRAASGNSPARGLAAADRALAALAAGFWREQPAAAAQTFRSVEAGLPAAARWIASKGARARLARARLLRAERIAAELARADVLPLDGWVLARSEAALAIYLQGLARIPRGVTPAAAPA